MKASLFSIWRSHAKTRKFEDLMLESSNKNRLASTSHRSPESLEKESLEKPVNFISFASSRLRVRLQMSQESGS